VQSIRKAVQSVGPASVRGPGDGGEPLAASGPIVSFKAYLEMSDASAAPSQAQVNLRSELQGCGVSLIDSESAATSPVHRGRGLRSVELCCGSLWKPRNAGAHSRYTDLSTCSTQVRAKGRGR
jgi:hypothetical protein